MENINAMNTLNDESIADAVDVDMETAIELEETGGKSDSDTIVCESNGATADQSKTNGTTADESNKTNGTSADEMDESNSTDADESDKLNIIAVELRESNEGVADESNGTDFTDETVFTTNGIPSTNLEPNMSPGL